MANKYSNTSLNVVSTGGGSNRVTIPATPYQIRGGTSTGGATSVPCKEALLLCPNGSSDLKVNIGTACTATTGIKVPEAGVDFMFMRIPIDDLNKLYFIGTQADVCDILYRT